MKFPAFLFPAYFIIIALVVAFPTIIIAVYLQIYKRNINKALNKGEKHSPMAPPHKVAIILTIAVLFVGISVSFLSGYKIAYNYFEKDVEHFSATDLDTFYAEVKEVGDNTITVEGISLNEEKYRGELQYEVWGEVSIVWNNEIISLTDLEKGDLVSIILITGEGHIDGITDIFKIQLLDELK